MLNLDRILVARDFSSVSDRALRHALELAARTGAALHVLHAEVLHDIARSDDRPSPGEGIEALRQELKASDRIPSAPLDHVSVVEVVRRDVAPAPALLNYAAEENIDLIALGTHGRRGPSRILLGSVAEEVVRQAQQPVLTVRGEGNQTSLPSPGSLDRILVPVDFSEYAREALLYAREWASLYDAEIDVLHVVEEDLHPAFYVGGVSSIYDVEPDLDDKVRAQLDNFVAEVLNSTEGVTTHVRTGAAASAIAKFADENDVDLVSLSTHGRTGLERFLLGSVAEKVVRHVGCPVLTVKAFGKSLLTSDAEVDASTAK
jgi:nucleotide-binding universal stress UspA family protein